MPTAGEFCNRRVVIARKGESLLDVARRMRDEHVGSVVVVESDGGGEPIPVGLLTDRDIVVRVLSRTDRHIHAVYVGDVMSENVVKAWEDEDLFDVLKRMRSFGIRRIPIVNRDGGVVGLIALDDVIDFLQEQLTDVETLLSRERRREVQSSP